jgi:hypothetical protein
MAIIDFDALPGDARVWCFGADAPLAEPAQAALLQMVDEFLAHWQTHGTPLAAARDWRDGRFLAVGVDPRSSGASGCSIDGLFRAMQRLGPTLGASLLPSAMVFWRDAGGAVRCADRAAFKAAAQAGAVDASTPVFDLSVQTAGAWRAEFERPASTSWHRALL